MNRKTLYIAVFIIAIVGLFIIQYKYLNIGLNLAKVQFNKNIGAASQSIKRDLESENQLTFLVGQAITKDGSYFHLSVDSIQDASKFYLNDFINNRLSLQGIDTDFSFRLATRDSVFYLNSPHAFKTNTSIVTIPIELDGYLPKLVGRTTILELQFKDLNTYFLFQLNGLTIPSLLFMLVIIVVFVWVLKSVYWQRQLITTTNAFINNLTHELKTPVFSIGLATKLLEEGMEVSKKPILEIVRQQTARINQLIDTVLELGKLEFQEKLFHLKEVDFKPHLIKICENFEMLSKLEPIQFTYDIKKGSYLMKAEVNHLENIISNILDNAQKYSENPIIRLTASKQNRKLIISITDNGIGINKKDKQLIFKKYYRVTDGDLHKVKGYGLGLSYVKEVLKKHRGSVKIDSIFGKGTTVTIFIPLINGNN
ncbi:MAG: HAMP domain-containing sensor histidine kinase [Aquaticitalea sp.]